MKRGGIQAAQFSHLRVRVLAGERLSRSPLETLVDTSLQLISTSSCPPIPDLEGVICHSAVVALVAARTYPATGSLLVC